METTIKQTTTTTQSEVTTDNAIYNITTTEINGEIKHISAVVFVPTEDDEGGVYVEGEKKLGTLAYVNGRIKMTALTADNLLPSLMGEFLSIINTIINREE